MATVWKPRARRISASEGTPAGMPIAWSGWPRKAAGQREVRIEFAEGKVQADWPRAFLNWTLSRAKASRLGLAGRAYPQAPRWSARRVSTRMRITLRGRGGSRWQESADRARAAIPTK